MENAKLSYNSTAAIIFHYLAFFRLRPIKAGLPQDEPELSSFVQFQLLVVDVDSLSVFVYLVANSVEWSDSDL